MWEAFHHLLFTIKPHLSILGLLLAGIVYLTKPTNEKKLVWALAALAIFTCCRFGEFQRGGIHKHDTWHYQMGSKYAKEVGYEHIYLSAAAAVNELAEEKSIPPAATVSEVRDLTNKGGPLIPITQENRAEAKARFSPQRWQEFRADMLGWHHSHGLQGWTGVLQDAGYNPSPWWSALGNTVNRLFPNTSSYRWMGMLDLMILTGAIILLARTFGSTAAGYATILAFFFPPGIHSWFDYTGMSFLRLSWVGWITAGFCALHTKRYKTAGACLAMATLERVFPAAWVIAIGATLAVQAWQNAKALEPETATLPKGKKGKESEEKDWIVELAGLAKSRIKTILTNPTVRRPLLNLAIGGIGATMAAIAYSSALLSPSLWAEFIAYIPKHGTYLYTNHFGWLQGIGFHPHINDINIPRGNLAVIHDWSVILMQRDGFLLHTLLKAVLCGSILVWAIIHRNTRSAAWAGLAIIFFTMLPAQYYLIGLLPVYAATFTTEERERKFGAAILIIAGTLCLPLSNGGISPWSLASAGVIVALAAATGQWLARERKWTGGTAGAAAAIFVLASPQMQSTPGGEPASLLAQFGPVSRYFLTENSKEIKDSGQIIPIGKALTFTTATQANHAIHFRTDHMFAGTLVLTDNQDNTIKSWAVEPRSSLFYTISTPLPNGRNFKLRWDGPGQDIAIFSIWTTKN